MVYVAMIKLVPIKFIFKKTSLHPHSNIPILSVIVPVVPTKNIPFKSHNQHHVCCLKGSIKIL